MKHTWYKEGVVYQIYPRSFQDSNGDGIGDLRGALSRLDYLKNLGITIIWLSPVYQSPNDDNGYDISDYRDIMTDFGSMADFDAFLEGAHQRGIKVLMDLVVNHTSDEHPWFQASRSPEITPYHDYYFWRKTEHPNKKPNNWTSFFGGDAWDYDATKGQHYLHLFSPKQPDLNWDNPRVREEVKEIIRFWLDKGVDGFRCDVITIISKRQGLPNGRFRLVLKGFEHYANGPRVHDYLKELQRDVFSHYDVMTVGEATFISATDALSYVSEERRELDMVIQFDHMNVDSFNNKWIIIPWTVRKLKNVLAQWQTVMAKGHGWNCLYFENHDQPRSISRFGDTQRYHYESGTLLATYLLTQQGTPFIYQGQEIGMTNYPFASFDDFLDVEARRIYTLGKQSLHLSDKFLFKTLSYMSRDNARTPMQWSNAPHAGFTTGTPWMRVNPNYESINVETALKGKSILSFYRDLIAYRQSHHTLVYGEFQLYLKHHPHFVVFTRQDEEETFLVVLNFSPRTIALSLPRILCNNHWESVMSNYEKRPIEQVIYHPYEIQLFRKVVSSSQ